MTGTNFVTADTHFGHAKAIAKFDRPFANVEAMDTALIDSINQTVGVDDTLFHLGDFVGPQPKDRSRIAHACTMRESIACKNIVLVRGNQDPKDDAQFDALFLSVHELLSLFVENTNERIVLAHYAQHVWQGRHSGALHLYGHTHGTIAEHGRSTDVGVDCWNYAPQPLGAVMAMLLARPCDFEKVRPRAQAMR